MYSLFDEAKILAELYKNTYRLQFLFREEILK